MGFRVKGLRKPAGTIAVLVLRPPKQAHAPGSHVLQDAWESSSIAILTAVIHSIIHCCCHCYCYGYDLGTSIFRARASDVWQSPSTLSVWAFWRRKIAAGLSQKTVAQWRVVGFGLHLQGSRS